MDVVNLSDESLRAFYESVRRQVAADVRLGGRYRLVGVTVRKHAETLGVEMKRRQLRFEPIEWDVIV